MTTISRAGSGVLLVLQLWSALAIAQEPAVQAPASPSPAPSGVLDRTAERERIRRERQAIDQSLQHAQAACYQRFAVEDCLRAARRRAREDLAVLRQQESMMDDSERRERAALRLRSIEERQSIRAAEALPASVPRASPPQASQAALPRVRPPVRDPETTHANKEERRQALQQRAAAERQRQAEKLQATQERKVRVQQRQAQDAARGRKPAAPLVP